MDEALHRQAVGERNAQHADCTLRVIADSSDHGEPVPLRTVEKATVAPVEKATVEILESVAPSCGCCVITAASGDRGEVPLVEVSAQVEVVQAHVLDAAARCAGEVLEDDRRFIQTTCVLEQACEEPVC